MQCPKCQAPMESVVFADIEVERCTACKGLYFDAMGAERLKKVSGSESIDIGDPELGKKLNEQSRIRCPRDTSPMIRVVDQKHPHIWTETCPVCFGSFFDAGEFRDFKHETFGDVIRSWFSKERR